MQDTIRTAITALLTELGITGIAFVVEHPADLAHGDYATNVALVAAKQMGQNPREVAERLRAALEGKIPHVASIELAGPGFINFKLSRNFFSEKIAEANSAGDAWGSNDSLKGEEVIFEYTSPNLMKPLHIGNLVGNIVGESLSRLMEWCGATVHRVNYPSDIGLTVAKAVWGLKKMGSDATDINEIGEAYRRGNEAYENDSQVKEEIEAVNRALYDGSDPELSALRERGLTTSRVRLQELMRMLGTSFDREIPESVASPVGTTVVREHIGDVFEESEGAIIYRGDKHGLHTRVFLNSQGLPTYEAKDLGNFVLKQEQYPAWNRYVVVTGNEQREYFKVLFAALKDLFPEAKDKRLEHIATGFLTLTTGKMSSRKGNVLTGESLIEEVRGAAEERAKESRAENVGELMELVAVAALKYQILRQSVGSDIVFDKERALSLEGDSGPYLQYTHARIGSVLEKASGAGIAVQTTSAPETPYEIEKLVYQFPEAVQKAQTDRAPHHLVVYLTELAGAFNTFYAHETIVDTNDQYAPYKLALSSAVKQTLKTSLYLLGIKAPERM
jgi:arginyl-tRNA synthetase